MSPSAPQITLDIFPSAALSPTKEPVSSLIYAGFIEHLGRCIYGGIVPSTATTFPYTPRNPCPPSQFVSTPSELLTTEHGFRKDVIGLIRDELKVPMMRWPGGNYVSSYRWEDGIGPKDKRARRMELAWGGEESNQFGTDEFIAWCREANCIPYICLNMGTGTLQDAINWVEYCNGTGDTVYANLRRKNTGRDEPHAVKYWGLGNEIWGPWQVGQQTSSEYAHKCLQWAHTLRLIDPTIKLVSCGETGLTNWDAHVLDYAIEKIDLHSIHLYTGFGDRDRSQKDLEYFRTVYGPEAAEQGVEICAQLIEKARVAKGVKKPIKIAFDEWNGWDELLATPENGLQQFYNLTDALSIASWLNMFIRQSPHIDLACLAQSVNVISPIITNATSFFRQTTYHPLRLFTNYMRDGLAVQAKVNGGEVYEGETLPRWIGEVRGAPQVLDVSAVLSGRSLRVAVVNRSRDKAFNVLVRVALDSLKKGSTVEAHEVWHEDVLATNGFDEKEKNVDVVTKRVAVGEWDGKWVFKEHSFTLLVLQLE